MVLTTLMNGITHWRIIVNYIVQKGWFRKVAISKNLLLVHNDLRLDLMDANGGAGLLIDLHPLVVQGHVVPGLAIAVVAGDDIVRAGQMPLGDVHTASFHDHDGLPLATVLGKVCAVDLLVKGILNRDVGLQTWEDQIGITLGSLDRSGILSVDRNLLLDDLVSLLQIDGPVMILGEAQFLDVFEGGLDLKSVNNHCGIISGIGLL